MVKSLDGSRLMTFEEFAEHLGVSKRLVQSWASDPDEKFPAIFLTERSVRVRVSEGNAWVDRRSERLARESTDALVRLKAERAAEARRQLVTPPREEPVVPSRRGKSMAKSGNKQRGRAVLH